MKKREALKGFKIMVKIRHLGISQYTVNRNYSELLQLFESYSKDSSIWGMRNRPKLNALSREFMRLMHNYLSSIYSLIQHTIAFRNNLNISAFNDEYDTEINKINSNPCVSFIRDLRTFAQHYELPFVGASIHFSRKGHNGKSGVIEQKMQLSIKELLKWNKWNKHSINYIKQHEKEIEINLLVEEYQNIIMNFYKWLNRRIIELFKPEIQELSLLENEIQLLQEG